MYRCIVGVPVLHIRLRMQMCVLVDLLFKTWLWCLLIYEYTIQKCIRKSDMHQQGHLHIQFAGNGVVSLYQYPHCHTLHQDTHTHKYPHSGYTLTTSCMYACMHLSTTVHVHIHTHAKHDKKNASIYLSMNLSIYISVYISTHRSIHSRVCHLSIYSYTVYIHMENTFCRPTTRSCVNNCRNQRRPQLPFQIGLNSKHPPEPQAPDAPNPKPQTPPLLGVKKVLPNVPNRISFRSPILMSPGIPGTIPRPGNSPILRYSRCQETHR